ncbi:MAG: inositol monophosphatase family protein [Candidatus Methanofastidiosia archaeon]
MDQKKICWDISEKIRQSLEGVIGSKRAHKIVGKGSLGGTTRYLDQMAENAALEYIKGNSLKCELISEEMGSLYFGKDFKIYLDPIDGSNNALSGIPFYSTSIAIFSPEKEYGLVRDLVRNEYFEGIGGFGSLFNSKPMKKIEASSKILSLYTKRGAYVEELLQITEKMRCLGSMALEMCYVARGGLIALVDAREKARPTDIAAAKIILENAGGIVTDLNGEPLELESNKLCIVASKDKKIHSKIINIVKK